MEKPKRRKFRQETMIHSYIHRPLSMEIIRVIWNTNISPNNITIFRVILNIASLILFTQGTLQGFVLGFIFFQIHEILDHVDGMYARLKKQTSKMGAYMEYLFDILCSSPQGLLGFSIAYGAFTMTNDFIYIWLFITIAIGNSLYISYISVFENEKIYNKESLRNIKHEDEEYIQIFGVGLSQGIKNSIYTAMIWKNEFLLWGALTFVYLKETYSIDTILIALLIHSFFFNISWARKAIVGYKKAKKLDLQKKQTTFE